MGSSSSGEILVGLDRDVKDKDIIKVATRSHKQQVNTLKIKCSSLSAVGILHLSKGNWDHLIHLQINSQPSSTKIGNKGCKYLSRISLPNILTISLLQQQIDATGAQHLSKGKWKSLEQLVLFGNLLRSQCFQMLLRGNWRQLERLYMKPSRFSKHELKYLNLSQNPHFNKGIRSEHLEEQQ